ncbi:MAG: hypothetical protein JZU65_06230 [Chlorobium sp.]|nr:hypothetical protein [Chlorobium sp.]
MEKRPKINRARTYSDLMQQKANVLPFSGEWEESVGQPELTGSWLIWGNRSNGKTRFAMQLCKYFAHFVKVAYNSLEEGASVSIRKAVKEVGMDEVKNNFLLLDKEPIEDLKIRLRKRNAPRVIFIDSWQYTGLNYQEYIRLINEFRHTIFVIVSHADGINPAGRTAKSINYDAFVKIRVEGYMAFPASRFGGNEPYTIWHEGAEKYYGNK